MSFPSELNFSPDYNNVDNYSDDYQFGSVIFPRNSPLLAEDINEAQRILEATVTRFNSAVVSDGVIAADESWYTVRADGVTFYENFCIVLEGKIYRGGLSMPAVMSDGNSFYAKFVANRIIDSNDELYLYGNKYRQKIPNYLADNFGEFEGKELSNRSLTFLESFSVLSGEPTNYTVSKDTPGTGGTVKYVKIGTLSGGVFEPNYAVSLISSKQGNELTDLVYEVSRELSAYQTEQLFNDFVSVRTAFSTNSSGAEVVTSTDKKGLVKITTFVSDTQITEVIKISASGMVLGTKTVTFVDENTITTVYS